MSKKSRANSVYVAELEEGTVIALPPSLKANHVRITKIEDANNLYPGIEGKVYRVEIEGLKNGVWREQKATFMVSGDTLCDVIKFPKSQSSLSDKIGQWFSSGKAEKAVCWLGIIGASLFVLGLAFQEDLPRWYAYLLSLHQELAAYAA